MPGGGAAAAGWLRSSNGNDWHVASTLPVDLAMLGGDVQAVRYATGLREQVGIRIWFVAERPGGRQEVRTAFYKESA